MEHLLSDLRYGVRMLWSKPGFTLLAVITLSLGIGANTTIFSMINSLLLKPIPYPEAERLVQQYQVVLHCEEGHWYGRGLEFPKVFADGETTDECVVETRKAMQGVVAFLIESGISKSTSA